MIFSMIDTQTSNLRSVENAFRRIGAEIDIVTTAAEVDAARAIVLPGVGAFEPARERLRDTGIDAALQRRALQDGIPVFGICLGMQLLATWSDENGHHQGLELIDGTVRRLDPGDSGDRVPNIGWCDVTPWNENVMFGENEQTEAFYFVHSYYFDCHNPDDIAAAIDFGGEQVPVAVARGNIMGVQFHPEKSQDAGLDLLLRTTGAVSEVAACCAQD